MITTQNYNTIFILFLVSLLSSILSIFRSFTSLGIPRMFVFRFIGLHFDADIQEHSKSFVNCFWMENVSSTYFETFQWTAHD